MQTLSRTCMGGITHSASQNCDKPTARYRVPSTIGKPKDTTSPQTATSIRSWQRWSKIKFVENPGAFKAGLKAHKTWQIQQDAYCELLDNGLSNPQKITCIIFENLFGPYFLPHQSHSYGYAPSSGVNLTSKMSFKSDATYYFHITKESLKESGRSMECGSLRVAPRSG